MTRKLFTALSDEHAQALVGGEDCRGNENVDAAADFVNGAHGLGCCHQADTNPGDTAANRHNFTEVVNASGTQLVQWANANNSAR